MSATDKTLFEVTGAPPRVLRHGGREVLRFTADLPTGDTAAARHARALIEALYGYAGGEPKRAAAAELEEAVRAGRGYAFLPYRCHISVKTRPVRRLFCVEIALSLTQNGEIKRHRVLVTYWNADGAWQYRRRQCRAGSATDSVGRAVPADTQGK